jgi:oxepin-CoA hydrolase/3-oxo-5,6-dehydrosuberyl-CoA semialdehyde dehydrogenase
MARVAVQGSPRMLTAVGGEWVPGAPELAGPAHPFRRGFDEIALGETIVTADREVTLEDIEHFARFTGDTFYAHMDEAAARANPFFPGRVAHGYLLLSFAAGLFVDPAPGPVLANTGLNGLRFLKPVSPGERLNVHLTARRKTRRTPDYGEVAWHASLRNGTGEVVAEYELLTMVGVSR